MFSMCRNIADNDLGVGEGAAQWADRCTYFTLYTSTGTRPLTA